MYGAKRELPIDKKTGKKMYPVCSWEKNQHKLYNAHDRVMNAIAEGKADYGDQEKVEQAMGAFEAHVIDGVVFATWDDRNLIMDYIFAYNARH